MDDLKCGLFIGGIRMDKDVEMLKNCHIAIGTPGSNHFFVIFAAFYRPFHCHNESWGIRTLWL